MRYWSREIVRSTFYEELKEYATTELREFGPQPAVTPTADYELITVDWSLGPNNRKFYLFGVRGNSKAKSTAIALLELKRADIIFTSLVVHENMLELGAKEAAYLTKNADKQYLKLEDFRKGVIPDINRLAA